MKTTWPCFISLVSGLHFVRPDFSDRLLASQALWVYSQSFLNNFVSRYALTIFRFTLSRSLSRTFCLWERFQGFFSQIYLIPFKTSGLPSARILASILRTLSRASIK